MLAEYLRALGRRERSLLAAGTVVVIAAVLYVAVLEPRYQRLHMLRAQVPELKADLAWMQQQAARHDSLLGRRGRQAAGTGVPLLTLVEQSATAGGLRAHIGRMQPAPEGRVTVWFEEVPFDAWLKWLDSLGSRQVAVVAATVDRAGPGLVNVRLTLGS